VRGIEESIDEKWRKQEGKWREDWKKDSLLSLSPYFF
jgi:hypothetical protein